MTDHVKNSTPFPNWYFDYIHLLTNEERSILLYTVRHTYGWKDCRDNELTFRMSIDDYRNGFKVDGRRIDPGLGMSEGSVRTALSNLTKCGWFTQVEPPNPAKNQAALRQVSSDPSTIDQVFLKERLSKSRSTSETKTAKARSVQQGRSSSVEQGRPTRPVRQTRSVEQTTPTLSDRPPLPCQTDHPYLVEQGSYKEETNLNKEETKETKLPSPSATVTPDQNHQIGFSNWEEVFNSPVMVEEPFQETVQIIYDSPPKRLKNTRSKIPKPADHQDEDVSRKTWLSPYWDPFCQGFSARYDGSRCQLTAADRKQLSSLLKTYDHKLPVDKWQIACDHYFLSPEKKHTMMGLCTNYAGYLASPMNEYGKPIRHPTIGAYGFTSKSSQNKQAIDLWIAEKQLENGNGKH